MPDENSTTLHALLQFALPLGTTLAAGPSEMAISWAVTIRAQPPMLPDVYGGELALVSMDVLRGYNSNLSLTDVIASLADAGIRAMAVLDDVAIPDAAVAAANARDIALLGLPSDTTLSRVERAVNTLIANYAAQINQRALEVQRQLTRLVAENRDLNALLTVLARATARAVVVHDDSGSLKAQVSPNVLRRTNSLSRSLLQSLPYGDFQNWLSETGTQAEGEIIPSPIGYTTALKVEKRIAGYLSLVDRQQPLDEFDRLVLTFGAEVCAIEMAKNRAIASAVEQTRGDWIQMWLSGSPTHDSLLTTRAQQSGFDVDREYICVVFRSALRSDVTVPLDSMLSFVRDELARHQVAGAAGHYVDVLVVLLSLDQAALPLVRARRFISDLRQRLAERMKPALVGAGISRPVLSLSGLRDAYREAKDAVTISAELGDQESVTLYGDLKLYQLLLLLKENNLDHLRRFYHETLGLLLEHDDRKHADLIRTLNGFFDANGNLAKAATDLDVHRNTLVYRLERIAELTHMNLDDPDNRLILHLALKIGRVLATLGAL